MSTSTLGTSARSEHASCDDADPVARGIETAHVHGIITFPVRAPSRVCTCTERCDCGKVPAIAGWADLTESFPVPQGYNFGMLMSDGVFLYDTDVRPERGIDGEQRHRELEAEHGPLPVTLTCASGSGRGGRHRFFKAPPGFKFTSNICEGIDIKGDRQFAVGPGSLHVSGGRYEVIVDAPIADAPAWLLEKVRGRAGNGAAADGDVAYEELGPGTERYEERRDAYIEFLKRAEPCRGRGGKGHLASHVGARIPDFELPFEEAEKLAWEIFNPRCTDSSGRPYPWSEGERDEFTRKLREGTSYAIATPGIWRQNNEGLERIKRAAETNTVSEADRRVYELCERVKARTATPRRRPDGRMHEYKYTPGNVSSSQKSKTDLATTIRELVASEDWEGVLQFDEFANRVRAVYPPCKLDAEGPSGGLSNSDVTQIRAWFQTEKDYLVSRDDARDAAIVAAKKHTYHPVREYLESLPPSDLAILDGLAHRLFGAEHPLEEVFLRKFLVQAVNRILRPGCQADTALVLYEPVGGAKKSTFVRELFSPEWSAPFGSGDMKNEESARKLAGKWAFELAEMAAFRASQIEAVKSFLTTTSDYVRDPYEAAYQDRPRQCVLVGTTNDKDILHDSAHARRFWIIEVKKTIDIEYLRTHRDEIWSAAYALTKAGEQYWLTDEEKAQAAELLADCRDADPWEDSIVEFCAGKENVTVKDIWDAISGTKEGTCPRASEMRIGRVLKDLKCEKKRIEVAGERRWRWVTPSTLRTRSPSPEEAERRTAHEARLEREKVFCRPPPPPPRTSN